MTRRWAWSAVFVCGLGCGRARFDDVRDADRDETVQLDAAIGGHRTYVKASNTGANDAFGAAVALSADGSTLVVGATFEDSAATGVDGDQNSNAASDSGAVYVFVRAGFSWSQQAYLKASNTDPGDQFGVSVAVSADGNTIAIGAVYEDSINGNQADDSEPDAGAVYLFTRTHTTWTQEAYVKAGNPGSPDHFGQSVALSADGKFLAVGANAEAGAGTGTTADPSNNSAPGAGAAYVFSRVGAAWSQQAYIKASNTNAGDSFGESVVLSADGATLAVGAYLEDSNARTIDGDGSDNSESGAGAVYVFTRTGESWSQQAYVKAANGQQGDELGVNLAMSSDGNLLAASAYLEDSAATGIDGDAADNSAPDAGAVYLFGRTGSTWSQQAYLKAFDTLAGDGFGQRLAMSGSGRAFAIGAVFESSGARGLDGAFGDTSAPQAGAVYLLAATPAGVVHTAYVKATNTDAADHFATVALSADGSTVAIGALLEDSAATGVDGDQSDNSAVDSGAVYVLE